MEDNLILEAALSYAANGYLVFPCKPQSKEPATQHGFKDATTDEQQIHEWWDENSNYNIGIPTGEINGFWVLDVDGEEGRRSLERFRSDIPAGTPQVNTGSGGLHLYFSYSNDLGLRGTAGKLPGLDIRTDGNYVIAPPSLHKSGNKYKWGSSNRKPTQAPDSLLKALRRRPKASGVDFDQTIPEGARNATITSYTGLLLSRGVGQKAAEVSCFGLNEYQCKPPLSPDEIENIVEGVYSRYEPGELRIVEGEYSGRLSRTLLSEAMRCGVSDPEELEPDVLLKGDAHQIFTGPEQGKTWIALWLVKNAVKRGQRVVFFDMENGQRVVTERLEALGVDSGEVDAYLHYYYVPPLDMSRDATTAYASLLDEVRPELVIFDSWIGFLAACGLDENSPTNVEEWANAYVHPAKVRGCTIVILDHVPHDANRSRGATRKKDLVDVQWRLNKTQDFDRSTVGYIQLTREKDREAWLPERVGFSVGGTEDGFIFKRSEGTTSGYQLGDGLTPSAREALATLEEFGEQGATYTEWREATVWKDGEPMSDSTFRSARGILLENKLIRQDGNTYYSNNSNTTAIAADDVGQTLQHSTAGGYVSTPAAVVDDGNNVVELFPNDN